LLRIKNTGSCTTFWPDRREGWKVRGGGEEFQTALTLTRATAISSIGNGTAAPQNLRTGYRCVYRSYRRYRNRPGLRSGWECSLREGQVRRGDKSFAHRGRFESSDLAATSFSPGLTTILQPSGRGNPEIQALCGPPADSSLAQFYYAMSLWKGKRAEDSSVDFKL